ncbi:MAG: hypothetical protein KF708_11600 [Pirellulales bacterium]|nr:hypothetical protein [Pirellulales bacterium]
MNRHRLSILVLGPVPIVCASLALSRWARPELPLSPLPMAADVLPVNAAEPFTLDAASAEQTFAERTAGAVAANPPSDKLVTQCEGVADELTGRLGEGCAVVVHAPFVIGGDLSREELEEWHHRTIGPASRAMAKSYFRVAPDCPVTVLLFRDEASYNHYAQDLYGEAGISVFGYYKPSQRVLVMNIATGGGTLVHELTHALMDFDFPKVPDWFNEGLASLHEQCRIRDDESGIDGLENWRLPILQQAIQQGRLRSLQSLIADDDFRSDNVGLNYAYARYFCLYLQRQDKLDEFFRRFRADRRSDAQGDQAVLAVLAPRTWEELDREFQDWVMQLKW